VLDGEFDFFEIHGRGYLGRLEDISRDVAFAAFRRNGVFDLFDERGRHGDVGLHLEEEEDGFVGILGSAGNGRGCVS